MRIVPETIPDADSEQVLARVCAIDVAKGVRDGLHSAARRRGAADQHGVAGCGDDSGR
jgi:hypothetical protein